MGRRGKHNPYEKSAFNEPKAEGGWWHWAENQRSASSGKKAGLRASRERGRRRLLWPQL